MADLARSVNIPLLRVGSFDSPLYYHQFDLESSHHGLLWRWQRGNPLVLQHLDDLYAINFYRHVFPVVKDASGWRKATVQEKDKMFFETHWISPQKLQSYGFDYKLAPQIKLMNRFACRYQQRCDLYNLGLRIGVWKEDSNEQAERLKAQNQWQQNMQSYSNKVMNDGKKCFDPSVKPPFLFKWVLESVNRHPGFHADCKAEAERNRKSIFKAYRTWFNRNMENFEIKKGIELREYRLLHNYCGLAVYPDNILHKYLPINYLGGYERSNPVTKYNGKQLADMAKIAVNAYGGCQKIEDEYNRQRAWPTRLSP